MMEFSSKSVLVDGSEHYDSPQILASSVRLYNDRPEKRGEVIGIPALRHDEGNCGARM